MENLYATLREDSTRVSPGPTYRNDIELSEVRPGIRALLHAAISEHLLESGQLIGNIPISVWING